VAFLVLLPDQVVFGIRGAEETVFLYSGRRNAWHAVHLEYIYLITRAGLTVNYEVLLHENFSLRFGGGTGVTSDLACGSNSKESEGLVFLLNLLPGQENKAECGFGVSLVLNKTGEDYGERSKAALFPSFMFGYRYHPFGSWKIMFRTGFGYVLEHGYGLYLGLGMVL
jgi:hypothetical protein